MDDCILANIPTTVNHQANKAEFDALCAETFKYNNYQRDVLAANRQAMEARLLEALRACPAVTEYTMLPDDQIVERLSYKALTEAAEVNVQDDDDNRSFFVFDAFIAHYQETIKDWEFDLYWTEEDPDEVAAQAGEMAYDRWKDDQA